ncbi:MAG: hypothetical protein ISR57_00860 [Bacteroidales bacterium]|nr:hypothetical protein [Bacteroidota bacterium]MBL6949172.1 hypothetical protein [Bacteroidales bacterium]
MENKKDTNQIIRPSFPNLLLISGSGRDTGKTRLGCMLIRRWKKKASIAAIKISPHKHDFGNSMLKLFANEGYTVWQERNRSWKDSGKFFEAGADPVFYVEAGDLHMYAAFTFTAALCGNNRMIICESGGLVNFVKPGVLVFIQSFEGLPSAKKERVKAMADLVITSEEVHTLSGKIEVDHGKWKL